MDQSITAWVERLPVEPHAKLLCNPIGGMVPGLADTDDLGDPERHQTKVECRSCSFGCIAVPPTLTCEPPAQLDGRHDLRQEAWLRQPGEADQTIAVEKLNREEAIAFLFPVCFICLDRGCGLVASASGAATYVAHDLGIAIELNKQVDIDKADPADVAKTWLEENGFLAA